MVGGITNTMDMTESPGGAGSGITWVSRPPPLPRSFSRSWSCEDAFPGLRPELDGYPIPAGLICTCRLETFCFWHLASPALSPVDLFILRGCRRMNS